MDKNNIGIKKNWWGRTSNFTYFLTSRTANMEEYD